MAASVLLLVGADDEGGSRASTATARVANAAPSRYRIPLSLQ